MKVEYSRTSVYALEYHIVFCMKYRRSDNTEQQIREYIESQNNR